MPGGRGSVGWSVGTMAQLQRPLVSRHRGPLTVPPPKPLASAPWPRAGEEAGPLPRNVSAPGEGGWSSTKPLSTRAWEGHRPSSLTPPPFILRDQGQVQANTLRLPPCSWCLSIGAEGEATSVLRTSPRAGHGGSRL